MKKLALLLLFGFVVKAGAEQLPAQYRTWKSSYVACNTYSNTLISSSPIIFHTFIGSPTVQGGATGGGDNYFAFFWSTRQPPTTDMSTKAIIYTNQNQLENSGMGQAWDVVVTTSANYRIWSYFSKQGNACGFYLWDWYQWPPVNPSNLYFEKN